MTRPLSLPVVYVSPYYDPAVPSGANRRFDAIGKRLLADFGDDFTLMVAKGKVPSWWNGKDLVELDYHFDHKSKFGVADEVAKELDRRRKSVVIMESIPIPFASMKRHIHVQCAYDFRYFYGFSKSLLYRLLFTHYLRYQWRKSGYMLTCSEFSIGELVRYVGYPRQRIVKSFFGINEGIFEVPHLPSNEKTYDLIYVGHFDGHKNHAPLIEALGMMDKGLKVLFAGVDRGKRASLEERAKELGLTSVEFTTIKDERKVWEAYTKSKVFVSPSLYEGFGMPTIEALALGVPAVVSDIPVFHEVGGDLVTYFDPHDPKDIKGKLESALAQPTPPDAEKVRARLEPYLWENIYARLLEDLAALAK